MAVQKRLVAAAPGYAGYLLEVDDGKYFHPIRNRRVLEDKMFVDELLDNPCRDIVVWRPKYPVLTRDFKSLFDFLRENPSEEDPNIVIPEVADPLEVEGPSAPRNLAAILQALENGDSEVLVAEYDGDASMEEADAEDHPVGDIPAGENHNVDLTMEAAVQNAVPLDRSCEASSGEPSLLAKTLEVIQKNQAELATRMDEQGTINVEFRSFMERQTE